MWWSRRWSRWPFVGMVAVDDFAVEAEEAVDPRLHCEPGSHVETPGPPEIDATCWVAHQLPEGSGKLLRSAGRREQPGTAVDDDLDRAADVGRHDGKARRGRFDEGGGQCFRVGGGHH